MGILGPGDMEVEVCANRHEAAESSECAGCIRWESLTVVVSSIGVSLGGGTLRTASEAANAQHVIDPLVEAIAVGILGAPRGEDPLAAGSVVLRARAQLLVSDGNDTRVVGDASRLVVGERLTTGDEPGVGPSVEPFGRALDVGLELGYRLFHISPRAIRINIEPCVLGHGLYMRIVRGPGQTKCSQVGFVGASGENQVALGVQVSMDVGEEHGAVGFARPFGRIAADRPRCGDYKDRTCLPSHPDWTIALKRASQSTHDVRAHAP